jgi:protein phosphatase
MKIAIISDIHGNLEALQSLPEEYDRLWVLGDLVNYGPNPGEVIDFLRERASVMIAGNHDHALAFGHDPHSSETFREAASAMMGYTQSVLNAEQKQFLRKLPVSVYLQEGSKHFLLCHATPSHPLFEYRGMDSPDWETDVLRFPADVLLTGHTHVQFKRSFHGRQVVNPGSLGLPKDGSAQAAYAIWDGNTFSLKSYLYDVGKTVAKLRQLHLCQSVEGLLVSVLQTGEIPPVYRHASAPLAVHSNGAVI